MNKSHTITQSITINAPAGRVWAQITQLDISQFSHPPYLALLGIPKPLRAEITRDGVDGARIAYFAGGRRFTQAITAWEPDKLFAFTFKADPGFRVGHLLDLSSGPFRMLSGAYRLETAGDLVHLELESRYQLTGWQGPLLYFPVRIVLYLFQSYLLRSIRANAERIDA